MNTHKMIKVGKVKTVQDLKDALCMLYEDAARLGMDVNGLKGITEAIRECEEMGAQ